MKITETSPMSVADKGKRKHFQAQMKIVFEAFKYPKTMFMASIETGIDRANICRFVSIWESQNKIKVIKNDLCAITRHKAKWYQSIRDNGTGGLKRP